MWGNDNIVDVSDLVGATLAKIEGGQGDAELFFFSEDGRSWRMYHEQDCCESVWLDDVCGDLQWLVGTPIIKAEEVSNEEEDLGAKGDYDDSYTWTFYHIATEKGHVTLRWYGSSNGYYSESVQFERVGGH